MLQSTFIFATGELVAVSPLRRVELTRFRGHSPGFGGIPTQALNRPPKRVNSTASTPNSIGSPAVLRGSSKAQFDESTSRKKPSLAVKMGLHKSRSKSQSRHRNKINPDGIRGVIRATAQSLPAEPVGVGATWRVEEVLPRLKYPVTVSSTVELLALKGDRIELRFESEAQGSATTEKDGVTIAKSTVSTARGTTTADLRELAAESAEIQESIKDRVDQDPQPEGPKWLEFNLEQTKTVRRL